MEIKENFTTVIQNFGKIWDIHFVDENSTSMNVFSFTWESYLGIFIQKHDRSIKRNGYRVVVPDLPGFGKNR
ncbi:MAG: hypothetical protein Ct9H90mP10_08960 [Actinomycetota bacterium]|nr:MAG: hypothetical protein Ct9H90mP10_08960 [Actinomycetota bacterium]